MLYFDEIILYKLCLFPVVNCIYGKIYTKKRTRADIYGQENWCWRTKRSREETHI